MNTIQQVENWLKEHDISGYSISDDLYVSVKGNVNLKGKLPRKILSIKFKEVDGYFDISDNELINLEGCPIKVGNFFNCSNNNLISLFDAPKKVGDFDCSNNKLVRLSYCPKEVNGYFDCSHNKLSSIKGSPRTIKDKFDCSSNLINSLIGGPKYIKQSFDCSSNHLKDLQGGPIIVGKDYSCHTNFLKNLDLIADTIDNDVYTDIKLDNILSSLDEQGKIWKYNGSSMVEYIHKPIVSLSNESEIKKWLEKHGISNFKILGNNSVNVDSDVRLSNKLANLSKLPLSFNEVKGNFDISDNELVSLIGSPNKVGGDFLAFKNELTSLKGSPKEVNGSFIILKNHITSIEFAPSIVKDDFICSHNPINNLDGINTVLGSIFTGVLMDKIKAKKYVYNGVTTYKYSGDLIMQYLDEAYVSLTDEERVFNKTRLKLENAISNMLKSSELKKEMVTDVLLNNLSKYHLFDLKKQVLLIKNPPKINSSKELSEKDILKMAFDEEL